MTPAEYDFLRKFLKERSGLVLSDEKQYLIESRLVPVARKHGLGGISERNLVSSAEVADLLLDVRMVLAKLDAQVSTN